jgi:hypothetical protein
MPASLSGCCHPATATLHHITSHHVIGTVARCCGRARASLGCFTAFFMAIPSVLMQGARFWCVAAVAVGTPLWLHQIESSASSDCLRV